MFPENSTPLVGTAHSRYVKKFLALLIFLLCFHAQVIWAQPPPQAIPFDRPGDVLPELPEFEPPDKKKILPDVPLPKGKDTEGLSGGIRIFIKRYNFSGNTVISDEELEQIAAPYTNKNVSLADLEKLRDEINATYINRGFINSGVVVPDQEVKEGVLTFQIIEGILTDVEVETDGRFRANYFVDRLKRDSDGPLDIFRLEKRLQILQMDDRIKSIDTKLTPGEKRGEAVLSAKVKENKPIIIGFSVNNYQPPTVGNFRGVVSVEHANLLGFGDRFNTSLSGSEAFQIVDASYSIPVTYWDTLFEIFFRKSWSRVQEHPFDQLEIDSRTFTLGGKIAQPLYRSLNHNVSVFLTGEYKRTETYLLGLPFTFALGPDDGLSEVFVIRFGQDYVFRGRRQVFAARSTMSFGLDEMDMTKNPGLIPDGQFFSWLGQIQYALRLPWFNTQVVARGNAQVADLPLLGLEQFR